MFPLHCPCIWGRKAELRTVEYYSLSIRAISLSENGKKQRDVLYIDQNESINIRLNT